MVLDGTSLDGYVYCRQRFPRMRTDGHGELETSVWSAMLLVGHFVDYSTLQCMQL